MDSAQWRYIRELMKKLAKFRCQDCGKPSSTLEVHHLNYERFGRERMSDLRVLCVPCHKIADKKREDEVQERAAQAWEAACKEGRERAYNTYMTKKYGEEYYMMEEECHREEFDEWLEKKQEREEWDY